MINQSNNIKQKTKEAGIDHGYSPNHGTAGLRVEDTPFRRSGNNCYPNEIGYSGPVGLRYRAKDLEIMPIITGGYVWF